MGERVALTITDGVGVVRIDNPPLNVIDTQVREELSEVITQLDAARDVRAVVLAGSERAFAAGADIEAMSAMGFEEISDWNRALQSIFTRIACLPMPVIAAVEGYALGGGMELALCADHRIAGDGARFSQPEILLGIIPGSGGTQRLSRLVGPSRAKGLLMSGRRVKPDEAERIGLIDQVVSAGEAIATAQRQASAIAAGPRFAIQAVKLAVDRGLEGSLDEGLALERSLFAGLFATSDREVGMRSFIENGPGKAEFGTS